jgi:hypothetical protein
VYGGCWSIVVGSGVVWMRRKVGRSGRGDYLYSAALASDRNLARFGKMVRAQIQLENRGSKFWVCQPIRKRGWSQSFVQEHQKARILKDAPTIL